MTLRGLGHFHEHAMLRRAGATISLDTGCVHLIVLAGYVWMPPTGVCFVLDTLSSQLQVRTAEVRLEPGGTFSEIRASNSLLCSLAPSQPQSPTAS